MLPFGRCLLLWRLHRGMSQAALAQKTRIPQPNLSDMERGERDVSLRTLRALAQALEVKPGVLADGEGPGPVSDSMDLAPRPGTPKAAPRLVASGRGLASTQTPGLSRAQLERISQAAVDNSPLEDPSEDHLARSLRTLTRERRRALAGRSTPLRRGPGRKAQREWMALSGKYPRPVLNSLIERIAEKLPRTTF